MSSEAVGRHMPTVVTLDDLTAMMAADESHRYEISPDGALSISPPPRYAHAIIATRLTVWLATAGVPAERIAQAVGLRIPGHGGTVGGRMPDLVVWSKPQSDAVWLPVADVLLVVEIVSPGSEGTDLITKRNEYAGCSTRDRTSTTSADRRRPKNAAVARRARTGHISPRSTSMGKGAVNFTMPVKISSSR